ncbi:hypothetical protein LSCM4_02786 [Leishmania orientalis]|uniref:Kinetoplast polyadenylation/uridylation factor 2 n=1 Tax=Leishmania orientalis TaxID=2249476 RepID=A0A836KEW7_9TRYP|nr:hypothetical protein LSCM4_02786 [Leishmania orientalis]
MPLLKSFNRCLRGVPMRPSAYANIHRWCSSPSQSPTPEQPQQAYVQASPITSSGLAASRTPASLDLGLNFAAIDFEAVARATHAAIARERGAGHVSQQREHGPEMRVEKQAATPAAPDQATPVVAPPAALSAEAAHLQPAPASPSASSLQERCDDGLPAPQRPQTIPSPRSFGQQREVAKYSLQDMLKDCVADGSWARAFQLFTNAVEQACRRVLVPRGRENGAAASRGADAAVTAPDSGNLFPNTTRESECFAAMRKFLAALPPTRIRDGAVHVKNMYGVMRWSGQHYYLLWKCLLAAGRLEEVRRVWFVMQHTGFVEYQMEERTVNAMMTLLRRTSRSTELMMATVVPPGSSGADNMSHQKGIRRELVKVLEQAAAARNFQLAGLNRRTAEGIRIAEALKRAEQDIDGGGASAHAAAARDDGVAASSPTGLEEAAVEVGDFNGLLRRARTFEATDRILRMMEKLNIEKEGITYASLIAALHNPQYVLPGHTAEELAAHQAGETIPPQHTDMEASEDAAKGRNTSGSARSSADLSQTKTSYEAYKQERIKAGMAWFEACPVTHRTADVFNELLYLLRAKSHWSQFDAVLVQLRGNAVVTETEWPEMPSAQRAAPVTPCILAPNWSTSPNSKTYELLIHRARYVHQWEVMWALYEEMTAAGVRGTTRVYEVLLLEARSHPPLSVLATASSSACDATSGFLLNLYDEFRRNGGDVRSLKGTVNVVSAWTKTRSRSNRRYV